jgi:hypothetical protein
MKKTFIIISFFSVAALTGCKKYLDQVADTTRTDLSTPEKVAQLLGTAYPGANYSVFAEAMSDNVSDKGTGVIDRPNSDSYYFNDVQSKDQDSPEFYWDACYAAIAAANQALEVCNTVTDSADYTRQKGEALLCRAYSHFMLVNFFSKFYDSTTANSDMGIPYVTEPETVVFKQYDRKTVAYTYSMIEQDILKGLPLINDALYTVPRYHFNRSAAYAFAARFYLFKKDYANAVKYANLVFPDGSLGNNLREWNTTYHTLTLAELLTQYTNSTEKANLLLASTTSLCAAQRYAAVYRYGMSYDIWYPIIYGGNVTGGQFAYAVYGASPNYYIPKFNEFFVTASVNANIGTPYVMQPLLTTEEVLFNRAEANTYLGNTPAAIADLNLFASKRILQYDASVNAITAASLLKYYYTTNLQQAVIDCILDFKRAEFMQEGMRWFDILRYKMDVVHYENINGKVGQRMELTPDDLRRVLQIPDAVKTSGIPLNPR